MKIETVLINRIVVPEIHLDITLNDKQYGSVYGIINAPLEGITISELKKELTYLR